MISAMYGTIGTYNAWYSANSAGYDTNSASLNNNNSRDGTNGA